MSALPTIFIVVTLSFFLMRVAPGGPFNLERPLEPQVLENLKRAFLLDRPLVVQYGHYLWNLLHGDLGCEDSPHAPLSRTQLLRHEVGAWLLGRLLRSQLYGVGSANPIVFASASGLLLLIALAACLVPSRRALRVLPVEALRDD